jgi:hypothetical protein
MDALGLGQVCLRAGLRETVSGGKGLPNARWIPIEVPEGAERGGQPTGKRAAGLRGRHSNHLHLCWSLRLAPIVPGHHCLPVEPRLRGCQPGVNPCYPPRRNLTGSPHRAYPSAMSVDLSGEITAFATAAGATRDVDDKQGHVRLAFSDAAGSRWGTHPRRRTPGTAATCNTPAADAWKYLRGLRFRAFAAISRPERYGYRGTADAVGWQHPTGFKSPILRRVLGAAASGHIGSAMGVHACWRPPW